MCRILGLAYTQEEIPCHFPDGRVYYKRQPLDYLSSLLTGKVGAGFAASYNSLGTTKVDQQASFLSVIHVFDDV